MQETKGNINNFNIKWNILTLGSIIQASKLAEYSGIRHLYFTKVLSDQGKGKKVNTNKQDVTKG